MTTEIIRYASITCFLTLVLGLPVDVHGQSATLPSVDEAEDSLDQLSRKTYAKRQQATLDMWRQREQLRDQVQQAARDPDPEVAGRAKWILRQWRRGALPDTPPEISRLLQRSDGPSAIEQLLEAGQFTAAIVAVEESAGTVEREAIQKRIHSALMRRFPIYVHHALADDTMPQLLELIDLSAESSEMAVCRLQLLQQMQMGVSDEALLPRSASNWPAIDVHRAHALALVTLDRIDDAIKVAEASVDEDLLRQSRMMGARWQQAADQSVQAARETADGSYAQARQWCLTLIAAERAGLEALVDEAVEKLSSADWKEDQAASELRWKTLAIHGRVDEALKITKLISPDAAASIAMDASTPRRAIEALGYEMERIDIDLGQWMEDALTAQTDSPSSRLTQEMRNLLMLMQCLVSIGREDAAWEIASRMSDSPVTVGSLRLREFVLSTLTMTRRNDWLVELAVAENEKTLSPTTQHTVAKTLADADAITFEIVMQAMAAIMNAQSLRTRFQSTYQLLAGEIPEDFDREIHFDELFEFVTRHRPTRQRGVVVNQPNLLANMNIVRLFARHGQSDLASACLQKLADSGDLLALFQLAEQQLDSGRADRAMMLFESVEQSVRQQGRGSGKFPTADDATLAVKALIGRWTIARRLGDDQLSGQLERELRFCLCSPSTQLRSEIADYLGERGEILLSLEAYEVLLPMLVLGSSENTSLYQVALSYAMLASDTHPDDAARWFDLAVSGTLDSINYRPGAYVTLPLYVKRWALEGAIQRRDVDAAGKHLERILELDPLDIDFAERLLPKMRKANMEMLADQTLQKIMDFGMDYAAEFPFDAMTANNLAWVAAMNRKRLDDALQLSEMAVRVEPDSAIYRDTLAEVLFLLGRKEEALLVEKSCLLDDPDQWHLHQQIEKYTEALQGNGLVP